MKNKLFIFMLCTVAASAHMAYSAASDHEELRAKIQQANDKWNAAYRATAATEQRMHDLENGHRTSMQHPEGAKHLSFVIPTALKESHQAALKTEKTARAGIYSLYAQTTSQRRITYFLKREFGSARQS